MTGIDTQLRFPTFIYWVICRLVQTKKYAIVQTVDPSYQNFISWTVVFFKVIGDEHTKSPHSPSVPINFPQMHKCFPSVLSKRVFPVSQRMNSKSAQTKPAKDKKTSPGNVSKRPLVAFSKQNNLEAKKRLLVIEECLQSKKVYKLPVISILTWYGAPCFRPCFCVLEFESSVSYTAGTFKVSTRTEYYVPKRLILKGN